MAANAQIVPLYLRTLWRYINAVIIIIIIKVMAVNAQIEDVEDERRNADRVMLAMRENLVQPGCSSQSSSFQSESTGFASSSLPFASSSVRPFPRGYCFVFTYLLVTNCKPIFSRFLYYF